MEVNSVGYRPAFTGYVDKKVNKLVDKAVKYAIEGTAKHADEKLTAETFQQIVERGNKVKKTFNDIVENAHPKTKLYIEKTYRYISPNGHHEEESHYFALSNGVLNRSTNYYGWDGPYLVFEKDKSSALSPLEELEKFSKRLATYIDAAKESETIILGQFLNDLFENAKKNTSKIHKWFNDRKARKAQNFAKEIGADTERVARMYENACYAGTEIADFNKKQKQIKKENRRLSKNFWNS